MRMTAALVLTAAVALAVAPAADAANAKHPTKSKRGPRGARGPQGPVGPIGPQGLPGIAGIKVQFVSGPTVPMCANGGAPECVVIFTEAACPTGMIAIGGGFVVGTIDTVILSSTSAVNGWSVAAINKGAIGSTIRATAVCMTNVGPPPA